jgi:cation diffusion facilitator family transporter
VDKRSEQTKVALNTVYWSIAGNAFLALLKAITGILGNSYALIADAIESTTDIFSSVFVLFGIKYASRPPDENHPYGHGKAEPLITFGVVGFLIISATIIAVESIHNIRTPHESPEWFTIVVLGAIVIFKEVSYRFVNKRSEDVKSSSLKADAWHHRSDAITSFMALLGISIALIMGEGYETADDWAALFASGFILYNAFLIFRPALGEIMDEHLHDNLINSIRNEAILVDGVRGTEKCFVRKTGMYYFVDLHILVEGDLSVHEGHNIAHSLKDELKLKHPEIADILIHVEPI